MSDYPSHHHTIPFPFPSIHFFNHNRTPDQTGKHTKRRTKRWNWRGWLYQTTFGFWIALITVLLGGSAWGLSEQALRGGGTRWNIFLILAAYVALFFISIAHIISRRISIKRILKTMPKPYVPTKAIDLPTVIADHIMVEYSRTAVIAHISQATKGMQEGWGRPGTKWENQHFRTYILSTIPKIQKVIPTTSPNPSPTSLKPLIGTTADKGLQLLLRSYEGIIENARYGKCEPDEGAALACEKLVDVITITMELKKAREKEEREKHGKGKELLSPFSIRGE